MALWDKVSDGINRAAKAAEGAIDDGKTRIAAINARRAADKKAAALGYAVARAKAETHDLDSATMTQLVDAANAADAEAKALEEKVRGHR